MKRRRLLKVLLMAGSTIPPLRVFAAVQPRPSSIRTVRLGSTKFQQLNPTQLLIPKVTTIVPLKTAPSVRGTMTSGLMRWRNSTVSWLRDAVRRCRWMFGSALRKKHART